MGLLPELPDDVFKALGRSVEGALNASLAKAATGHPKLGEVRAVGAVVTDGMREVASRWRRAEAFRGRTLHLLTVFCHSAPHVTFTRPRGGSGRCELADLLVVIDDPTAESPEERRRAVLIQAKLLDPRGVLSLNGGNERVQFELLSGWPAFTFVAGFYKPHARDLTKGPGVSSSAGEYGGVEQPPRCSWTQYLISNTTFASRPPVHGDISLGLMLAGMLDGRTSFGRPTVPHGRDPWSETVQELLDVTYQLEIMRSQPTEKRGRTNALSFHRNLGDDAIFSMNAVRGESLPPDEDYDGEGWPDGGISIAHFTLGRRSGKD